MTPIWLIPPLALFLAYHRFVSYYNSEILSPKKFMYLAKAVVDLFFAVTYTWFLVVPGYSSDRAEISRLLVLVLITTHALSIVIENLMIERLIAKIKSISSRKKDAS